MTNYISKALEGNYKEIIKSLNKIVENEIDKKRFRFPLFKKGIVL